MSPIFTFTYSSSITSLIVLAFTVFLGVQSLQVNVAAPQTLPARFGGYDLNYNPDTPGSSRRKRSFLRQEQERDREALKQAYFSWSLQDGPETRSKRRRRDQLADADKETS